MDVLTDIIQTYTIFTGIPCGSSSNCTKQDPLIAYISIPFILLGIIATIISIYNLCRKPSNPQKYHRITDEIKIIGENIPTLFLILHFMYISIGS